MVITDNLLFEGTGKIVKTLTKDITIANSFEIKGSEFYLNGKPFKIYSGAVHYFRTLPEYWEDRLLKLKLAGFNTVETYVCRNLHEPENETYLGHVRDYLEKLFSILKPLFITNGGNIIAMQIENEYGSYSNDKKYLCALFDMYDELGVDILKFTSDGAWCNILIMTDGCLQQEKT